MCGVSATTVSRTVNGRAEGVGPETRQRILDAIRESGYQPNTIARSMVTKKTNTIALVIPDICNPFFAELARGVGDICAERGYHLFLGNTDGKIDEERGQVRFLREQLVDGVVLTTQNDIEDDEIIRDFIDADYPFVLVERYAPGLDAPLQVLLNNAGGIEKLVSYLFEHGHREIAFVGGPEHAANAALRFDGYKKSLEKFNLRYQEELVMSGDYKMQSGYDATKALLERGRPSFSAIVVANDLMAIGACNAITDAGLQVPDDISVVGFDNLPLTKMVQPRITTVGVSINELGRIAATLLCERLAGNMESKQLCLECQIVEQSSVKKLSRDGA